MTDLQRLIDAVREARADIAPTYHEYVQLAFALATECGEAGRSAFHDLCRFSTKYDAKNADKVYTSALSTGRGEVKIGTAYHLAKQAGVTVMYHLPCTMYNGRATRDEGPCTMYNLQSTSYEGPEKNAKCKNAPPPSHTHTRTRERGRDRIDDQLSGSDPSHPLPIFPTYAWPEPLSSIIAYGDTPWQRDILLLGAVTVLGATLERRVRFLYDIDYFSPCLQAFVIAPPASGKGVLSLTRRLVEPIHEGLRWGVEKEVKEYQKKKAEYDSAGKDRAKMEIPQRPPNRMFLIPGNNSGTGILQNLIESDGTGLIFEPEADTLSGAIGSDYGHFSDMLRNAFDHGRLSFNRRTDQEYREIPYSYLSVLLSGTPAQVKPFIPSAENGLFSRQLFYYMPGLRVWMNKFSTSNISAGKQFREMGAAWKDRLEKLKEGGLYTMQLTDGQQEVFNQRFAALFLRAGRISGDEMNSSVARLAINLLRILSVVAVLRGDFTPDKEIPADNLKDGIIQRWDVHVRPEDFEAVMGLLEPLYRHATHILSFLPPTEVVRRTDSECNVFFSELPERFTRQQVKELAGKLQVNEHTAISWLYRWEKQGRLTRDDQDVYSRT